MLITSKDVKEDQDNKKRITYTREKGQTSSKKLNKQNKTVTTLKRKKT